MSLNFVNFSTISSYVLALHTTSPQLGLSISNLNEDLAIDRRHQIYDLGRDLSTHLHYHLLEFIQPQTWQNLAFIAVAKGPGSFTGTRIGVVTARTLAQQLNIPLFGISTLAAVAWNVKDNYPINTKIAIEMPATRGELFVAIYEYIGDDKLLTIFEDTTTTPQQWQEILNELGTDHRSIVTPANLGDTVDSILELATLEYKQGKRLQWSDIVPFYGQHPVY
jgi:tRNA threonylcarbamoyl adenosine modification protein YeaZ